MLRTFPRLPRLYLEASADRDDVAAAAEDVEAWLRSVPPQSRAAISREVFASPLAARRPSLLAAALQSASELDVPAVLDVQLADSIEPDALGVVARFARDYPRATTDHLLQRGAATQAFATVLAAVLPLDGSLLDVAAALETKRHPDCALDWLVEALTRRADAVTAMRPALSAVIPRWIVRLLRRDCLGIAERTAAIRVLLGASRGEGLWEVVEPGDEETPVWASVRREVGAALLPGLTRGYLVGRLDDRAAARWAATATVGETLRTESAPDILKEALEGVRVDVDVAGRIWAWVAEVGSREPDEPGIRTLALVEDAFATTRDSWPPTASGAWQRLLAHGRARRREPGLLDVHAVRTCLAAPGVPLSKVLLDAFPWVYAATVEDGASPLLDPLWLFADWDKGKDLRARLIDAYVAASWPAGDLALTASRSKILAKVVSRATREGHQRLLRRALEDLEARGGTEHAAVARQLRELLERRKPESWD